MHTIPHHKIRIAVIGCGRIAANHFGAIAQHAEDMELIAVCDTDPAVLQSITVAKGVPGYALLKDLLAASNPSWSPSAPPAACTRTRPSAPPAMASTS